MNGRVDALQSVREGLGPKDELLDGALACRHCRSEIFHHRSEIFHHDHCGQVIDVRFLCVQPCTMSKELLSHPSPVRPAYLGGYPTRGRRAAAK